MLPYEKKEGKEAFTYVIKDIRWGRGLKMVAWEVTIETSSQNHIYFENIAHTN